MVTITMDQSALTFYYRHPEIGRLIKLEQDGKVRLYHAQNLNRDLGNLSKTEEKIYHTLRNMVFGKAQQDLNLADHGDLVLLVNHLKNKRDYFLTMDQDKYVSLHGHKSIDVRFPDRKFLKEVEGRIGILPETANKKKKTSATSERGKKSKISKNPGKGRKKLKVMP